MTTSFVFPGQGSQFVGMGRDLYASSPAARAIFDEADKVLGYSLSKLCFEGPEEKLNDTEYAQPAILTVSVAYLEALREKLRERGEVLEPAFWRGTRWASTRRWWRQALPFADGCGWWRAGQADEGRWRAHTGRHGGGDRSVGRESVSGGGRGQFGGCGGYRQLELACSDSYIRRGGRAAQGDGPGARKGRRAWRARYQHSFAFAFDAARRPCSLRN